MVKRVDMAQNVNFAYLANGFYKYNNKIKMTIIISKQSESDL